MKESVETEVKDKYKSVITDISEEYGLSDSDHEVIAEFFKFDEEILKKLSLETVGLMYQSSGRKVIDILDEHEALVPKQEELEAKIQELIEVYKQEDGQYSNPENAWIGEFIEDLENLLEEEQKYYVLGKYDTPILFRDHRSRITETSNLSDIYPKADSKDFEFTEQEIKDYDPRYMTFAKPVEELE